MKAKKGPLLGIGGLIRTTFRRDIFSIYSMVYDQGVLWLPLERVNRRSDRRCGHLLNWNRTFLKKGFEKPPLTVTRGHRNRSLTGIPKSKTKRIHPKRPVLPFLSREQSGPTSRSVLISDIGPIARIISIYWDGWRASGKAPGGSSRTHSCTHTHVGVGSCVTLSNW